MKNKVPTGARDGAKKIVTWWEIRLCDRRERCAHDHSRAGTGGPERDVFADMRLIDELWRLECGQLGRAEPVLGASGDNERLRDDDAERGQTQEERISTLIRSYWAWAARWLGLPDGESTAYTGEEGGDISRESAPA